MFSIFYLTTCAQCPDTIVKAITQYPFRVTAPIQKDELGIVVCTNGLNRGSVCQVKCPYHNTE